MRTWKLSIIVILVIIITACTPNKERQLQKEKSIIEPTHILLNKETQSQKENLITESTIMLLIDMFDPIFLEELRMISKDRGEEFERMNREEIIRLEEMHREERLRRHQ